MDLRSEEPTRSLSARATGARAITKGGLRPRGTGKSWDFLPGKDHRPDGPSPDKVGAPNHARVESTTCLVRPRLDALRDNSFVVLAAPAGHGKSTTLRHLAHGFDGLLVRIWASTEDGTVPGLLSRLSPLFPAPADGLGLRSSGTEYPGGTSHADGTAIAPSAKGTARRGGTLGQGDTARGPETARSPEQDIESALARLSRVRAPRRVLVTCDDFQVIADSPGGRLLLALGQHDLPWLSVMVATRTGRDLDIPRLRRLPRAVLVTADDLRFRSWEVERLFRDVYDRPLAPEDAAQLTAKTNGWAAGLAMFDLITRDRSIVERRRALDGMVRASRLVREYLVTEVLGCVDLSIRDFLRRTSALGVLSGPLCDQLLRRGDSTEVLEELEQRELFTHFGADGMYRYHQLFQDHLELELRELLGPWEARVWYRRCGLLLLDAGHSWAAFRAFARGEHWADVEGVLAEHGADIVDRPTDTLAEAIPQALRERDPWLALATARMLAGHGATARAVDAYDRMAALTEDAGLATLCRRERSSVAVWLPEARPALTSVPGLIRAATQHGPRRLVDVALGLTGGEATLAAGIAALLAGDPTAAEELLREGTVPHDGSMDPHEEGRLLIAEAVVHFLGAAEPREQTDERLTRLLDTCDSLAPIWRRLAAGLAATSWADVDRLATLVEEADTDDDQWGAGLLRLFGGIIADSDQQLNRAEDIFAALEAPVLVHWARCLRLLRSVPASAQAQAQALVDLQREGRGLGARDVATTVQAVLCAAPSTVDATPAPDQAPHQPLLSIRLLGGFDVAVDGRFVDLRTVRPRARAILQYLSLNAGRPVHRDVLADVLWQEADPETGRRGVQVAVSALRSLLEPGRRRCSSLIRRCGDAYILAMPSDSTTDALDLERLAHQVRGAARAGGNVEAARLAWLTMRDLYQGDLLPEQGDAEWVVHERDRLRLVAADALECLGRRLIEGGAVSEGVSALRLALDLDRFREGTWHALIEAFEAGGDQAAAAKARQAHRQALMDLGIEPTG